MKKLTLFQLEKIKRWSYRGVLVLCAIVFILFIIPKDLFPDISLGQTLDFKDILMWSIVILEVICLIITIFIGRKILKLKVKELKEILAKKQADSNPINN